MKENMNANTLHRLTIPEATRAKLDAFRKRVWTIKVAEGICAAFFGLLLSYLLVFVLDRFVDTPAWVRGALLVVGAAGLGIGFPMKCHRWVWQTRRFDQLARLLKHRMPRLSDRLLGIIELAQNDIEQQRSAALCEAALRQVDSDIKDKSFDDAVPDPRHRAWGWAVAAPAVLAVLVLLCVPSAGINALKRWLAPWSLTERYTFTQLDALPAKLVVPYSEPFSLTATLSSDSAWTPRTANARVGEQLPVAVERTEDKYEFELPPQKEDGVITLSAGDVRASIPVEPKLRPELIELTADIKLPDYLQYSSRVIKDARSGTISVVRGSEATLVAKASRKLVSASLNGTSQSVLNNGVVKTKGAVLNDSSTLALSWADEYGLTAKQPFEINVEANEDAPPTVVCSELDRQQVVMVDQVLTFEVNADDDFGLREIGIEWQGLEDPLTNPNPAQGDAIIKSGEPESTELTAIASFSAAREGIKPQTLLVRLFAVDYLPGRERVYSPPYTLYVLSEEDHANYLAEQLRRWSRSAQEVYERENQLLEDNKALRELGPEQLARKDIRDRIESQAIAERANARQLTAVSAAGKELIREASRNDQFNVMTMEGLAQMVKTLDEMANNRMPSVANLLKKAATAPANAPSKPQDETGDGGQSSEEPSAPSVGNNRDPNNTSGQNGKGDDDKNSSKPTPSISDVESSMNQPTEDDDADEQADEKNSQSSGAGRFGLPTTTVLGGGVKQPPQPKQDMPQVEEILDDAIAEQEELLDAFSKIAEELQRILDNLEGSTFVKRFKAASRRQLSVANSLNDTLSDKFGRRPSQLSLDEQQATNDIVEQERAEKDNLAVIKQDLEAYYNRVQQGKFLTVINEMDSLAVATRLETLAELVADNMHGQSIAHAEFWGDTFDRWAEQLVGPG